MPLCEHVVKGLKGELIPVQALKRLAERPPRAEQDEAL
jgi:hypothetical protein